MDYKWKSYGQSIKIKKQRNKRFFLLTTKKKICNYNKSKIFPFKYWLKRGYGIHRVKLNGFYYYYAIVRPTDWILSVTLRHYRKKMSDVIFTSSPFFKYLNKKKRRNK